MNIVDIGTHLEHQGWDDDSIDEYLAHFGVKGMRWGSRKSQAQQARSARARGMGPNQLRSENARVNAAGGGMRGTLKVRKEMIRTGELSKSDAHKGAVKFGRNLAIGLLAGAGAGYLMSKGVVKISDKMFENKMDSMVRNVNPISVRKVGGKFVSEQFFG